jgi:MFS family permease
MTTASAKPVDGLLPPERFTLLNQFFISCLWFAYNLQWGALLVVVLPSQVQAIVGPREKEQILGILIPIGAFVSLVITPIAGALSDRCRHPMGRRRPYLIAGILINVVFLAYMAGFGPGDNVWLFALGLAGIQFGCNLWGGPYAGLIPDVVPPSLVGRASGWQALMTALGTISGALAGSMLTGNGRFWPVYALIIAGLLVGLALTVWGVREKPLTGNVPRFELVPFLRTFLLDPKEHRNFYWVLITRCFVAMGVYSILNFFLFFLQDVIRVDTGSVAFLPDFIRSILIDPKNVAPGATSLLMAIIIGMGIPTSILAGSASDRHGRKPLVYLSGAVMAVACCIYVAVVYLFPTLPATLLVAALFGIGNGAYLAVDWALAVDVLPGGEDAAKDMGIWHVALVLPQMVAPAITGFTLAALKPVSLSLGYTMVFAMATVWFILGTVFIRQIRGVR